MIKIFIRLSIISLFLSMPNCTKVYPTAYPNQNNDTTKSTLISIVIEPFYDTGIFDTCLIYCNNKLVYSNEKSLAPDTIIVLDSANLWEYANGQLVDAPPYNIIALPGLVWKI